MPPPPTLTQADIDALPELVGKVQRGESLTPSEQASYDRIRLHDRAALRQAEEDFFAGGAGGAAVKAAGTAGRLLRGAASVVRKHPYIAGAAAITAEEIWRRSGGEDGDTKPGPADASAIQAIIAKVASGQALTPAEIATLQAADPELAAAVGGAGTVGGTPKVSGEGSTADILDRVLRAMVEQGDYSAKDVADLATKAQNLRDAEKKQLRLDDGTVISQEMIENADPTTRAQYEMELEQRSAKYENAARDTLNAFDLQQYAMDRTAVNDSNTRANNDFRNRVEVIRQRLELDKITIEQASAEVSRALNGMGESRDRTTLETETALKAAPFASPGGKTEFTGNDLGGAITGLARIGGVANPETTPLVKFPGTIRIDPAARMAEQDAALGVSGPLATIPKITVSAGDVPGAPGQAAGPAAPALRAPVRGRMIEIPRYNPNANNPYAADQYP